MTGGRAVRAPGRLRGPQGGTDGQGGRGTHEAGTAARVRRERAGKGGLWWGRRVGR